MHEGPLCVDMCSYSVHPIPTYHGGNHRLLSLSFIPYFSVSSFDQVDVKRDRAIERHK